MKKFTLLLVMLLIASVALFGCGGGAEPPAPVEQPAEGDAPAEPATTAQILANQDFRLALNYALDREEYVAISSAGLYAPATRFVLPAVAGASGYYTEEYPIDVYQSTADLEKAQEHLQAAMTALNISDPSEISITIKVGDNTPVAIPQNCQDQWTRNLGINVDIDTVTYRAMLDDRVAGDFDLVYAGWMPDYNDPYTYLSYFVSSNAQNGGKYNNARYDELVNSANSYTDAATRLAMYAEAEQILLEEAGIIPLQVRQVPYAVNSNVQDLLCYFLGASYDYTYASMAEGDQHLRMALSALPTIDFQNFNAASSYVVMKGFGEGLVRTYGTEINPGVAESWEVSEDNMTMTFHLREDAKWHDGTPITANDFVYSFRRLADPEYAYSYSWVLSEIKNAAEIMGWVDGVEMGVEELGVSAPDDHTFVIEFWTPAPYYLGFLDMPCFYPVPEAKVAELGDQFAMTAANTFCNGPFIVTDYVVDQSIVLEKNPEYWNADAVKLDKVTISIMADDAAFALLETGALDFSLIPPAVATPYVDGTTPIDGYDVYTYMSGAVDWYCINMAGE